MPPGGPLPHVCPHCQSHVLGAYCDLVLIGSGAMGDVYRGRRPDMGNRPVAIKIPKAADPQVHGRFEREIAASALLRHENIVCAFDRGEVDGRPYLVMEYVDGRSLSQVVETEHPLRPAHAAEILRQVARGLAHAEQHGIVNRDIKPDNILISEPDGVAKILDYGLAVIADLDSPFDRVTRTGTLLGTPGFLAPEQAVDPRGVGIAADVYALGCTGFYMLCRRTPFTGKDSQEVLRAHAEAPRPQTLQWRGDVGGELSELIASMMAVDPRQRPRPREIVDRIEAMLPRLSRLRPVVATVAADGRVPVRCPGCGETYRLRADMIGKQTRCLNKTCSETFFVQAEIAPTAEFAPLVAEIIEAEAIEAEAIDASPEMDQDDAITIAEASEDYSETEFSPLLTPPLTAANWLGETRTMPPDDAVADAEITEADIAEADIAEADIAEAASAESEPEPIPLEAIVAYGVSTPPPIVETVTAAAAAPSPETEEPILDIPATALVQLPPRQLSAVSDQQAHVATAESAPAEIAAAAPAISLSPLAGLAPKNGRAPKNRRRKHAPPPPKQAASPSRGRRSQRTTWLVGASVVLLGLAGVALLVANPFSQKLTAEERWQEIQDIYLERKWNRAEREFAKFHEEFPEHEHVPEIPYFLAMCEAGENIYSDTGNCEQGLASAQRIFREHRDSAAYKAYCSDLYQALSRLVERFSTQAMQSPRHEKVDGARQSLDLLKTVAEAMMDKQLAADIERLEKQVKQADDAVQLALARAELFKLLTEAQTTEPLSDVDEKYARVEQLLASHPVLAKEKELPALQAKAYDAEAARVKFVPRSEDADDHSAAAPREPLGRTLVVVWDARGGSAATGAADQVVTALSRGVLYAFDAQGNFLWHRRLGADIHRLPGRIEATATSPLALAAVSTEDSNSLLALEAATGEVLWQYHVGSDILAPLSIVTLPGGPNSPDKQRGLLPSTGQQHEIHVLELVLGKQLGRFVTHVPMAPVGGAFDAERRLIYFPADQKRVLAINPLAIDDPDQPACKSVLFSDHASGSLRSEPAVVGPYYIMAEASQLDSMQLRAFQLAADGFGDPKARPLAQPELAGWSWFPPRTTPDRITLITDEGDLGVFGLNLDNAEESIYRIVEGPTARLPVRDYYRSLAVHADEHLLWVMTGGTLRMLSLDVLHKKINPIWPTESSPATLSGIPLHEAQMDRWGEVFYLATMSQDGGHFDFTAVESNTGQLLWQRQLGMKLHGDPLVVGGQVVLVDHSGRTVVVDPNSQQTVLEPSGPTLLPPGTATSALVDLASSDGAQYLAARLAAPRQLALARLEPGLADYVQWQTVALSDQLQGRPCLLGDYLIVPGKDGHLYRDPIRADIPRGASENPFRWSDGEPGLNQADVYPLSESAVLLVDGARRVRRLELKTEDQVTRWQEVGGQFNSATPLIGKLLVHRGRAIAADGSGRLLSINTHKPSEPAQVWSLPAKIMGQPFLRGNSALAVMEDLRLACIRLDAEGDTAEPTWISEPFSGRVRGEPMLAGDVLLVADDSRRISGIRLSSGEKLWEERLRVRVGPAAAAAPLGNSEMLVPLTDGTMVILPRPQTAATAAEAAP
jgi:outer membrane protein assembly factor BamB